MPTPPIKFYNEEKFFKDFDDLPKDAKDDLLEYLDRLQRNPDNPELRTEDDGPDRFAYRFHAEYAVYCHLERERPKLTILWSQVLRIEVLSIEPLRTVLQGSLLTDLAQNVKGRLRI